MKLISGARFVFIVLIVLVFSSCGIFRLLSLNKKLNVPPTVDTRNFKEQRKFRLKNGWIFMYAKINGGDSLEFMLDSGSPSFMSFKIMDSLKIKSDKVINSIYRSSVDVSIGKINYQNTGFIVINYDIFRKIIGVNLMQNQVWSFNFKDSVVTITDRLDYLQPEILDNKIHFTPLSKQKTPVVKFVADNGDTATAFIDLGNSGSINLSARFDTIKLKQNEHGNIARWHYWKETNKKSRDTIGMYYGFKFNSLKIGNYAAENITASDDPGSGARNLIGLGFLKNFIVTIDWIHDNIYLKPIEGRKWRSKWSSYGMQVDNNSKKELVVFAILQGSDAEKQGIRPGDRIEMINNIPADSATRKIMDMVNDPANSDEEIAIKLKGRSDIIHLKKSDLFN